MIWTIVVTALLTGLVVVIGLNFATPTKQLEKKMEAVGSVVVLVLTLLVKTLPAARTETGVRRP